MILPELVQCLIRQRMLRAAAEDVEETGWKYKTHSMTSLAQEEECLIRQRMHMRSRGRGGDGLELFKFSKRCFCLIWRSA
jgi:hypothetical protein